MEHIDLDVKCCAPALGCTMGRQWHIDLETNKAWSFIQRRLRDTFIDHDKIRITIEVLDGTSEVQKDD